MAKGPEPALNEVKGPHHVDEMRARLFTTVRKARQQPRTHGGAGGKPGYGETKKKQALLRLAQHYRPGT